MKTINLDFYATNLDGTENKDLHVGQMVAQLLYNGSAQSKDALKLQDWAFKLFNKEELSLDESDTKTFTQLIKESTLPVWAAAPILKQL